MEKHKNPSCGYGLLEETSLGFQMGLRFDVASDQLSAQPHSHSNSEKKASRNIEQHLYGFDINGD